MGFAIKRIGPRVQFVSSVINQIALVGILELTMFPRDGWATPVNHGDFVGSFVTFQGVTDDSTTDPEMLSLFGLPIVSGNSLIFNPPHFISASSGAGESDNTTGTLTFMIDAKPGRVLRQIRFEELGDHEFSSVGSIGTVARATALTSVDMNIVEVDNLSINEVDEHFELGSSVYSASGGSGTCGRGLHGGGGSGGGGGIGGGGGGLIFSGSSHCSVEFPMAFPLVEAGHDFVRGVTKVEMTIETELTSRSEAGISFEVGYRRLKIAIVPEPASLALLTSAAAFLSVSRRRRA